MEKNTKFIADINKFVKKASINLDEARKQIIIELFERVIKRTPHVTGKLRGNWLTAIGSIPSAKTETLDPTGNMAIKSMKSKVNSLQKGSDLAVFMVNNQPYAYVIEHGLYPSPVKTKGSYVVKSANGYSKQAPAGMVRISLLELNQIVKEVVGRIHK